MTEKIEMVVFFKLEVKGRSNIQCISSVENNTSYKKLIQYFHYESIYYVLRD